MKPEMDRDLLEFIRSQLRSQYLRLWPPYCLFRDKLREFTSKEFEILVSDLFRQLGCNDVKISPAGADGATDILCKTSEGDYIVQCKKWKAKVGVATVREVYGAAVNRQAKGAFIVTVSKFTRIAIAEKVKINLHPPPAPQVLLIDGLYLFDLMNQHMPSVVADIQEGIWKSQKGSGD